MSSAMPSQGVRSKPDLRRPDLLREQAFVAGRWIEGLSRIEVRNPASGARVGSVPNLGAKEATEAITAAHQAFGAWRARTAAERATVLRRWFDLMNAHLEDLARILTIEQGKPLGEARGEIGYAASFLEWFAEEARRAYGDIIPGPSTGRRLSVVKQPVGVVAAITPWNFPSAMITRKVAPALAVGCTVVLKPSELTPFSALALAVLAEEAGVPAGVFSVVTGEPAAIGDVLTRHPLVRKFSFTGSTPVGRMLAARCMEGVKRVSLELGGNAPFIVFDDAKLEAAVEGALQAKFRNAGQTCVCANRILVQSHIYDAFSQRFAERASELVVGDGLAAGVHLGPLINTAAVRKVEHLVADAMAAGAKLLTGGGPTRSGGLFFAPTVLADVPATAQLFRNEIFGPVAALTRFSTEAEVIALANDTDAGLAAYLYTSDLSRAARVSEALEFGMVGVNAGLVSTVAAPFGGVKTSGFGREGSRYGLDDYLDIKLISTEIEAA